MKSSRGLKLIILSTAIAITVLPKIIDYNEVERPTSDDLKNAIVKLLKEKGFETRTVNGVASFLVYAQRANCLLQIQEAVAEGYTLRAIEADTPKDARLAFVFRGQLLDYHPTALATAVSMWTRIKWRLGMNSAWSPTVSIAATGACAIESLPWNELAEIIHE